MSHAWQTSAAPTKLNWWAYAACAEGVDAQGVQFHGHNSFGQPRALRHIGDARQAAGHKFFYAPLRRLDFLTSILRLLVVFRSMELTREWRWTRNEKSLVPPMTTDLAPVGRLTLEFCG
jgi:hypothetical protein